MVTQNKNPLKRLSVTISVKTERGYTSKETINDPKNAVKNLLKAIEELAYLVAINNIPKEAFRKAIHTGCDKANSSYLIDESITF